ncbi:NAD(P)H-binding protein [Aurantiacibacter aquimixticola]|uniref:NmrA family transcriptional regulator n=1 Tax=Aurantiacibacter aquimixticola TaxID=1958945 RepID=A0A419RNF9_9SPHN|nr:NAD(P)H-binding protein [Aurantiacibacter aquimixticola]RJY06920.1 NmrA family transcriptional regulator [Aurantiacibacter aquimixticola]
MIVITAPTGDIASRVVSDLIDGPEPVRLIARDPSKLSAGIRQKAEVVEGSHSDLSVVEKALIGADSLFWLVPSDITAHSAEAVYVDFARPVARALENSNVTHVVSISAVGRNWSGDAGHASASIRMDGMLAATGVNYAALACVSLMSNVARQVQAIAHQNTFYAPAPPDLELRHVAPVDVATKSAQLLRDRDWKGFIEVPMLGPVDLSFNEIASTISDCLGREIVFQQTAMDEVRSMMLSNGASEGMATAMTSMLTAKNDGLDHLIERSPEELRASPTSFRKWCETELAGKIEIRK